MSCTGRRGRRTPSGDRSMWRRACTHRALPFGRCTHNRAGVVSCALLQDTWKTHVRMAYLVLCLRRSGVLEVCAHVGSGRWCCYFLPISHPCRSSNVSAKRTHLMPLCVVVVVVVVAMCESRAVLRNRLGSAARELLAMSCQARSAARLRTSWLSRLRRIERRASARGP
jgi:hypothetical protein